MTLYSATAVRACTALSNYLHPRLAPSARGMDFTPLFSGVSDSNYDDATIDHIIRRTVEMTDNRLAYDANVNELSEQLHAVAPQSPNANGPNANARNGGYPPEVIERVRRYLEKLVTPQVLQAAMQILTGGQGATPAAQNPMSNPPPPSDMGEDARGPARFSNDPRARESFFSRFPEARRMRVEPDYRGVPQAPRPAPVDPSIGSLTDRFPAAGRMRHV